MKRTTMTTRVEALKIARYLGCSGAHETESGWMPCSNHQTLMKISNQAEKSLNSVRKSKRKKKGKRSDGWEELTESPVVSIDTLADGSLVSGVIGTKAAQQKCPEATQSVSVNLRNRQKAIRDAKYGPLNPNEPSREYWKGLAEDWDVSVGEAKKQRCGNCAAFVKTPEMLSCINTGIGADKDSWSVIQAGDLGYCEFFDFKCASKRTCSAWVVGGPITGTEKKELSARTVRSSDPDVFDSPESARVRSRQLGCIGIRRYSSSTGKPAWMPCTNESDYRRRMGTSEQGRLDIAKRQMREMRLAIGKMRTKSAASTPAPKKDQIFGSSKNPNGSARSANSGSSIELSDKIIAGLRRSMTTHNQRMDELNKPAWTRANLDALKVIYRRGAGAFSTSHRPNVTRSQWAMGRVRAFLWMLEKGKPKKLSYVSDNDMLPQSHPFRQSRKSVESLFAEFDFDSIEEKGLGKFFRGIRPNRLKPRKFTPKPMWDGDGDGKITNPLTGRDDLPFNVAQTVMPATPAAKLPKAANPKRTLLSRMLDKKKKKPSRMDILNFSKPKIEGGVPDKPKFPTKIFDPRTRSAWVRDEFAEKVGDTWVRGDDVRALSRVPVGINMSLRQWNGLSLAERRDLSLTVEDKMDGTGLSSQPKTIAEWEKFLNRRTHRLLDAFFPDIRERFARGENISVDSISPSSYDDAMDRLLNSREIDFPDDNDFSYMSGLMSPLQKFRYDSRKYVRQRNIDDPNINHGNAPMLTEREYWHANASHLMNVLEGLSNQRARQGSDLSIKQVATAIDDSIEEDKFGTLWGPREMNNIENSIFDLLGYGHGRSDAALKGYFDRLVRDADLSEEYGEQGPVPTAEEMMDLINIGFSKEYADTIYGKQLFQEMSEPKNPLYDDVMGIIEAPPEGLLPKSFDDPDFKPYLSPTAVLFSSDYEHLAEDEDLGLLGPGPKMDMAGTAIDRAVQTYNAAAGNGEELAKDLFIHEDAPYVYGMDLSGDEILKRMLGDVREWYSQIMDNYAQIMQKPDDDLMRQSLPDIEEQMAGVLMSGLSFMPKPLKSMNLDKELLDSPEGDEWRTPAIPVMLANALRSLYWEVAREKGLL